MKDGNIDTYIYWKTWSCRRRSETESAQVVRKRTAVGACALQRGCVTLSRKRWNTEQLGLRRRGGVKWFASESSRNRQAVWMGEPAWKRSRPGGSRGWRHATVKDIMVCGLIQLWADLTAWQFSHFQGPRDDPVTPRDVSHIGPP